MKQVWSAFTTYLSRDFSAHVHSLLHLVSIILGNQYKAQDEISLY